MKQYATSILSSLQKNLNQVKWVEIHVWWKEHRVEWISLHLYTFSISKITVNFLHVLSRFKTVNVKLNLNFGRPLLLITVCFKVWNEDNIQRMEDKANTSCTEKGVAMQPYIWKVKINSKCFLLHPYLYGLESTTSEDIWAIFSRTGWTGPCFCFSSSSCFSSSFILSSSSLTESIVYHTREKTYN